MWPYRALIDTSVEFRSNVLLKCFMNRFDFDFVCGYFVFHITGGLFLMIFSHIAHDTLELDPISIISY